MHSRRSVASPHSLDIEAIRWLEKELQSRQLTALVVTHDRSFLSAACSQVLELDQAAIYKHAGSYEQLLESKQARLARVREESGPTHAERFVLAGTS